MTSKILVTLFLVSSLFVGGCATLFSSKIDEIKVDTEPSGAKVFVNEDYIGTTPVQYRAKRDTFQSKRMRIQKDGYTTKTIELAKTFNTTSLWNIGFITTTFGVTSWGIDALNGTLIEYDPKSYVIPLQRASSAQNTGLDETDLRLDYVVENYISILHEVASGDGIYLRTLYEFRADRNLSFEMFVKKMTEAKELAFRSNNGLELYRTLKTSQIL